MNSIRIQSCLWVALSVSAALMSANAAAQNRKAIDVEKARVVQFWTPERRAAAIPRDLRIDPRGLGYLRRPDGTLVPYGHNVDALTPARSETPSPFAKPGGGTRDTTPPTIGAVDPSGGTIGSSYVFKATVTDDSSGVKSVSFKIQKIGSIVQSFSATKSATDSTLWTVNLSGFANGDWTWWVVAKDNGAKGGNTTTSATVAFAVDTGSSGGGGGSGDTVTNEQWTGGGTVEDAAGRIYFEMPNNRARTVWSGYVCSGTVATDETSQRSLIITAAHCVYDDANKAFARNVLFIPNQASSGTKTDLNCNNDVMGCWTPSFGVVDVNWTTRTFPDNIAWDYALYVVNDVGAHSGTAVSSGALDVVAGSLLPKFDEPSHDTSDRSDYTHALGYSYSEDPKFMYCAEDMTTEGSVNWWLPSCGLSGGSSGGSWLQPVTSGNGPIISVNSWGYTNSPGMAGPKLFGTSASNVFSKAKCLSLANGDKPDGDAGVKVSSSTVCP